MKYSTQIWLWLLCCTLLLGSRPALAAGPFDSQVQQASLVGGSGSFQSVKVRSDGIFLIAGNLNLSDQQIQERYPGLPHYRIDGGGGGIILHYSSKVGQVVALTTLRAGISDMEVGEDDSVYLALEGQTLKLNPQVSEKIWQGPGDQKLSVAADGSVFTYSKSMKVTKLNPDGTMAKQWGMPKTNTGSHRKRGDDIVVDRKNRLVIVSGNNSGNSKKSNNPVFVPWVMAFDFNGKHKWTMFNYTHTEVDPWGMADSRAQELLVKNGKLYIIGESEGGNSGFRRDAQNPGKELGKDVAAKNWANSLSYLASSARKISHIIIANPKTGKTEKTSAYFGLRMKDDGGGREEAARTLIHDIAVDEDGRIYVTGEIGGRILKAGQVLHSQWPGESGRWKAGYGRVSGPKEFFMAVFSPDLNVMEYSSGFAQGKKDTYKNMGFGIAAHQGNVVVAGAAYKVDDAKALSTLFLKGSLNTSFEGEKNGYYLAFKARSKVRASEATHFQEMGAFYLTNHSETAIKGLRRLRTLKRFDDMVAEEANGALKSKYQQVREIYKKNTLGRLKMMEQSDPQNALARYKAVALFAKGTDLEETVKARLEALDNDVAFQQHLLTFGAYVNIRARLVSMDAKGSVSPTSADPTFAKKNRRAILEVEKALRALTKKYAASEYTQMAVMAAQDRLIPSNSQEKALLKQVETVVKSVTLYRKKTTKKKDKKALADRAKKEVAAMVMKAPDSPFTKEAQRLAGMMK